MTNVCCISDCSLGVSESECSALVFHRFPEDPRKIKEWLKKLRFDTNFDYGSALICERHFSLEQYDYCDTNKRLKYEAVPDCHIPNIEPEDHKKKIRNIESVPTSGDIDKKPDEGHLNSPLVIENLNKICRLCLETDEHEVHQLIFTNDELVGHIQQSIGIEIVENDDYPQKICKTCIDRVNYIHQSREWFQKNDLFLRSIVEESSLVENEVLLEGETYQSIPQEPIELSGDVPDTGTGNTSDLDLIPEPEEVYIKEESELAVGPTILESGFIEAEEVTPDQVRIECEDSMRSVTTRITRSGVTNNQKLKASQKICKTPGRKPGHACGKCYRTFDTQQKLKLHMNSHKTLKHFKRVNLPKLRVQEAEKLPVSRNAGPVVGKKLFKEMAAAFNCIPKPASSWSQP